jgi:hypothetical protein
VLTKLLARLGTAGAILIASVVFFVVLGTAVVVHRFQVANTATVHEKGEVGENEDQGKNAGQGRGHSKAKHPGHGHNHASEPPENSTDND